MDKSRKEWSEYFEFACFKEGGGEGRKQSIWKSAREDRPPLSFYPLPPSAPKIAIRKVDCTYAFSILFELKFGSTFLPSCVRHVWQIGLWLLREVDERLIQIGIYRRWMEKWRKLIERLKVIKLIFILWRWKLI